jgi:hypothetical protein
VEQVEHRAKNEFLVFPPSPAGATARQAAFARGATARQASPPVSAFISIGLKISIAEMLKWRGFFQGRIEMIEMAEGF